MTGNHECIAVGYPIDFYKDLVVTRMCNDVFLETKYFLDKKIVPQFSEYPYRFSEQHMSPSCEYDEQEDYLYRRCQTDKNSDRVSNVRKISLFAESCDIASDEVVTSLRFHESEGMIYIKPQCGIFADG
ncbi:uncharacterized protein LOC123258798 [Cotesia glomerata]|uniref:Uncharacterized protein n=1 Tax=Cotesia glomerata TaxID=32391 RepID=A0AAV7HZT5_COTGL|nr:uncharacterized protein LOC123258798 [Cotesia glomerata]KAH0539815.1 hypothetical protein KQX54_008300 [Cotesia glomerata]